MTPVYEKQLSYFISDLSLFLIQKALRKGVSLVRRKGSLMKRGKLFLINWCHSMKKTSIPNGEETYLDYGALQFKVVIRCFEIAA